MSIDLVVTLWADDEGRDRAMAQHPVTETDLVDVTEQFTFKTVQLEDGRTGLLIVQDKVDE